MSQLRRNLIANVAGRGWATLSIYLFVPFYLELLGVEAYGLVASYALLLNVLVVADLGVKATLSRELARLSSAAGNAQAMRDLLRTAEIIFLAISTAMAAALVSAAPVLTRNWLNPQAMAAETMINAFRLMGLSIALYFLSQLPQAGLLGLQRHVVLNTVLIGMGFVRGVGSILVLWLVTPTITAFFAFQVLVNAMQAGVLAWALWRALPPSGAPPQFRGELLRSTWRYTLGMALISLNAAVLSQLDRLVVSRWLPLSAFGVYSLASMMAQTPVLLVGPLSTAVLPWFTQLVQLNRKKELELAYHKFCQLAVIVAGPLAAVLTVLPGEVMLAWTGDINVAASAGRFTPQLALGSLCLALQVIPYCLCLSHGYTKLNVLIGLISLLIFAPLTAWLVSSCGSQGVAWAWLCLHASIVLIYVPLLHHRLLPGSTWAWYLFDCGAPLLAAMAVCFSARLLMPCDLASVVRIVWLGSVWLIASFAACVTAPQMRAHLLGLATQGFAILWARHQSDSVTVIPASNLPPTPGRS